MNRFTTLASLLLISLTCTIATNSASAAFKPPQVPQPAFYDVELINQHRALTNAGYDALDQGDFELALAKFTEQLELMPQAKYGLYNLACAYGRTGKIDEGIEWLEKCVAGGWDDAASLNEDPDLESLKASPRFTELLEAARENRREGAESFVGGLPVYVWTQFEVEDQDAFEEWVDTQESLLRKHSYVWRDVDYIAAKLHFHSQRLGRLRKLRQGDKEYDFRLERVRALGNLVSPWDPWGGLADAVVREAELYFKNAMSIEGSAEANYFAGLACLKRYGPERAGTPERAEMLAKAKMYFSQVPEGTEYAGAANAGVVAARLEEAGPNRASLLNEVRDVVTRFRDDAKANRIASVFFPGDGARAIWPIEIQFADLDGDTVSLDEYQGKVLLIDFWATWCGPCRAELPNLVKTYNDFHDQGLEIVSISIDEASRLSADSLRNWVAGKGMNWRHIYTGKRWDADLADRFMVDAIPSAFLVGRDGSLLATGEECYGPALRTSIERALAIREN